MSIKVEKRNNNLVVIIPSNYKEPYWLDNMYKYGYDKPKYIKEEDGTIVIECRHTNVVITKPIIQQTPMGVIQSVQTLTEEWVYFDVPELSILVNENDVLTDTYTLDDLKLKLNEEVLLEDKKELDTND
jgi:hypothetical protein